MDRLQIIEKINTTPTSGAEMAVTLENVKALLLDMHANPADPSKNEAFLKAAADLEAAQVHLAKVEKDATLALELAKDAAAAGPAKGTKASAFKKVPLIYRMDKDAELSAMFGGRRAHFNLVCLTREDMRGWDAPEVATVQRFQYVNTQLATMHALMMGQRREYVQRYIEAGGWKTLPFADEFAEFNRQFSAAMDTAESGNGSDWVPTGVNTTLIQDVRPEHMTRNMFQTLNMSRSPQLFPVQGSAFRAYLLGENTADHASATVIGQRGSATASVTFTAKKFGALTDYSRELLQDSIVALATAVRVDHAYAHGETEESIIWNAQLGTNGMGGSAATSSSFDTGVTFGATAGSVDDRAAWDGLRLLYSNGSCTTPGDAGAGLIADLFTDQIGQMGKFGVNPADTFIGTSFLGLAKLMVLRDNSGRNVTLTADTAGGRGTFQDGVIAQAFGRPVLPSTQYPQAMNASGVVDGVAGSTKTAYHIVNRRRFAMGEVQVVEIASSDQVAFDTDQIVVRSIARKAFKAFVAPSNTETSIGAIYNV